MEANLKGLSGGPKQIYNRQHRDEILSYRDRYGDKTTCKEYNLKQGTLERLALPRAEAPTYKLTKTDILEARVEICEEDNRELRREVKELKQSFGEFTEIISERIKQAFVASFEKMLPAGFEVKDDPRLAIPEISKAELKSIVSTRDHRGRAFATGQGTARKK